MQFPDRDKMTKREVAVNNAVQQHLVRGKYYRFEPPVTATAVPTGGPDVCALEECTFERGWYLGLKDGNYVFQGKPVNDQRLISVPQGYENDRETMDRLRDSYFHILFIGRR